MSELSRDALVQVFSTPYPPMVRDVVAIIHAYYVPCPITWQSYIPAKDATKEDLRLIEVGTQNATRLIEFPDSKTLIALRTAPLTDCTQTRFQIRLKLELMTSSIYFKTVSVTEQKLDPFFYGQEGQEYRLHPKARGRCLDLFFLCVRSQGKMAIYGRDALELFIERRGDPFTCADGDCLEIQFPCSYASMRVVSAEILPDS